MALSFFFAFSCSKNNEVIAPGNLLDFDCKPTALVLGLGGSTNLFPLNKKLDKIVKEYFFQDGHYLGKGVCGNNVAVNYFNFSFEKPNFLIPVSLENDSLLLKNYALKLKGENLLINFKGILTESDSGDVVNAELLVALPNGDKYKRKLNDFVFKTPEN